MSAPPLLEVDGLHVEFRTRYGTVHAVRGVDLTVFPGQTLAIVGESGCGKTVTALAIMGIGDSAPGYVTTGHVRYGGRDLLAMSDKEMRTVRSNRISMIFQDALSALNPVFTVGFQIAELFRKHRGMSRRDSMRQAVELLDLVKIPGARDRVSEYPHQFSGGMRQRVMIAMALALEPEILIADEPTTAVDVTVQAQIMSLLVEIQQARGMSLVLITHDMGVVANIADRIAVMYAGKIVEQGMVDDIYRHPAHPYTRGLLSSIPRMHQARGDLEAIPGRPPELTHIPSGCAFSARCGYVQPRCLDDPAPELLPTGPDSAAACHRWNTVRDS